VKEERRGGRREGKKNGREIDRNGNFLFQALEDFHVVSLDAGFRT